VHGALQASRKNFFAALRIVRLGRGLDLRGRFYRLARELLRSRWSFHRTTNCKEALLHAKSVVIDGSVSIVGSSNLDMRSFVHNDEVNAIVVSRDFGQRMEQVFQRDERASRPVQLDRWEQRSVWQRIKEFSVSLFGYWL
jgi:phosphatidylserine/phosphatidylglycerophosphate/cardiolipin synthase-like enzyme